MFDFSGFVALAAGLSVGMGGLAAGYAIGIVGDYVSILFFINSIH
jgi:F0F1-type ATP synthase membrane subunit c/vacuolar-type H+-ATPase subunit K